MSMAKFISNQKIYRVSPLSLKSISNRLKKMEKINSEADWPDIGYYIELPTQSIVQSNRWLMAQKVNEHLV